MSPIVGIIQALIVIYGAWWGYKYYTGRLNFSGAQEIRRVNRVRKYGPILIVSIVLCAIAGPILLILKVAEFIAAGGK